MLLMENDYNDLQEEVNDKSKLLGKLRKRYKAALAEIQDLEGEHYNEKADLLETIRTMEVDLGFYKSIVDMMMNENNLYKIKSKSSYNDEKGEWEVPPFIMKGQQMNLPKLGLQKAMRFVEEEKNSQMVEFKNNDEYSEDNFQETAHHSQLKIRKKKKNKKVNRNKSQAPPKNQSYNDRFETENVDDTLNEDRDDQYDQFRDPNGLNGINEYGGRYGDNNGFGDVHGSTEAKLKKNPFRNAQPKINDYNGYGKNINSEPKLPPSLKWALDDESRIDEDNLYLHRNQKANVHLAPLGSKMSSGVGKLSGNHITGSTMATSNTIYGSPDSSIIDKIPSVKKLSSQKTRRLQPLRR